MTDLEFDILDELYFVQSFQDVQNALELDELELKEGLARLIAKTWVKCLPQDVDEVIADEELDFENNYKIYHYLATKEGLLAHNTL